MLKTKAEWLDELVITISFGKEHYIPRQDWYELNGLDFEDIHELYCEYLNKGGKL